MTMVPISSTHNKKTLTLTGKGGLSWNKYPLQMTSKEQSTVKMSHALTILGESCLCPSAAAGLKPHQIVCPIIGRLDKQFRAAILDYQLKLNEAEANDLVIIRDLEQRNYVKSYGGWFGWIFRFLSFCGASIKSPEEVALEGSVHRKRWIYDIDTKECTRLKYVKDEIVKCIQPVIDDITELNSKKQDSTKKLKELYQLTAVFKAIFPKDDPDEIKQANLLLPPDAAQKLLN